MARFGLVGDTPHFARPNSAQSAMDVPRRIHNLMRMYALVMYEDGFEFLVDPRDLWRPPRLFVRRERCVAEVQLEEGDVCLIRAGGFSDPDRRKILLLVEEYVDELLMAFYSLKNDVRCGRLARNTLVD